MKHLFLAVVLVATITLTLAASGVNRRQGDVPGITTVPALDCSEAIELYARAYPDLVEGGTATAAEVVAMPLMAQASSTGSNPPLVQGPTQADAMAGTRVRAIPPWADFRYRGQNNVHGVEMVVSERPASILFTYQPFLPPPLYAADLIDPRTVAHAVVRHKRGPSGATFEYPMTQIAPGLFVVSIPRSRLHGPWNWFCWASWDQGADPSDDLAAFDYGEATIILQ